MKIKATFRDDGYAHIPRGFRELKKGQRIRASDRFLKDNKGPWTTLRAMDWEGGDAYDPHTNHKLHGHHTHIRRLGR